MRAAIQIWWPICGLVCLTFAQGDAAPAWAEGEGDVSLLAETRDRYLANRGKLQTWEGRLRVVDRTVETDPPHESEYTFSTRFYVDVLQNRYACESECEQSKDVRGGETHEGFFNGARYGELWLPDSHVHLGPILPQVDQLPAASSLPGAPDDRGWGSYTQHPLSYGKILGEPIDAALKEAMEVWRRPWCLSSVSQDGNRVTLIQRSRSVPDSTNTAVFDWERGGNLVEFRGRDPLVEETWIFTYELMAEIWLPKTLSIENWNHRQQRLQARRVDWLEQAANLELPEDVFSLDGIHAPPGTIVSDHARQKTYVFRADEAPPLNTRRPEKLSQPGGRTDDAADAPLSARRRSISPWTAAVNAVVIVILLTLVVRFWLRSKRG